MNYVLCATLVAGALEPETENIRSCLFGSKRLQVPTHLVEHLIEAESIPCAILLLGVTFMLQTADTFLNHNVPFESQESPSNVRLILL